MFFFSSFSALFADCHIAASWKQSFQTWLFVWTDNKNTAKIKTILFKKLSITAFQGAEARHNKAADGKTLSFFFFLVLLCVDDFLLRADETLLELLK